MPPGLRRLGGMLLAVAALCTLTPARADAWGFKAHRLIAERAIALLPPGLRPFFETHRVMFVEHSIDPDLWRTAGFLDEPPRHFLDLDGYGTEPPFAALPRDFDEAVRKYGREHVEDLGTLPWRTAEFAGHLQRAFDEQRLGTSRWATNNVLFFASTLAHYVADAHVPQHAVKNFDGQLTNQLGLHDRFEVELVTRYGDRLRLTPGQRAKVTAPRALAFDALVASFKAARNVEAADREAIGDAMEYDERYFDRFFEGARPVLEERLTRAIEAVAGMITYAWEAGGSPELPLDTAPVVRKRTPATGGE